MNSLYYKNEIKIHLEEKRILGFMVSIFKFYENKTQDYYWPL